MRTQDLPPDPQLMESLRAVGYSVETAVADIIDNSLAAGATTVDICFAASTQPYIAIVDDGRGMNRAEAKHAMCLAATSALETRSSEDLGRFGLGLKTASLSQCRRLTVLSKKRGSVSGFCWDLDHLQESGRWSLLQLDADEIQACVAYERLATLTTGTLVLWEGLDQLPAHPLLQRALDEQMSTTQSHLSLVFHRYLSGEATGQPVRINMNGRSVAAADPFLTAHKATQRGHAEVIRIRGADVAVQPYTLPHISKLSRADREKAHVAGRLRDSQGFYIYRGMRLVIWGTWFRLVPKDDLAKLARVRVDIPNSLDHLWSLDIKKSAAVPPLEIRDQLRRTVNRHVAPSRTVHLYRGRQAGAQDTRVPLWNLVEDRNSFRYEINRAHPALEALSAELQPDVLRMLTHTLTALEAGFPIEDAYNRLAMDQKPERPTRSDEELLAYAESLWSAYRESRLEPSLFVRQLQGVEPFATHANGVDILERATLS
ncbi:ATP-binding protein [Geodermatophilus sp. URMC 63]